MGLCIKILDSGCHLEFRLLQYDKGPPSSLLNIQIWLHGCSRRQNDQISESVWVVCMTPPCGEDALQFCHVQLWVWNWVYNLIRGSFGIVASTLSSCLLMIVDCSLIDCSCKLALYWRAGLLRQKVFLSASFFLTVFVAGALLLPYLFERLIFLPYLDTLPSINLQVYIIQYRSHRRLWGILPYPSNPSSWYLWCVMWS